MDLLAIQNVFVEIMFKYMVRRFGYEAASMQFAGLIKNAVDQNQSLDKTPAHRKYEDLVQAIVKEAERTLTLYDDTTMDSSSQETI